MKAEFEHRQRRDILSIATRVGLGLILVAAWLSAGGSSQPETPHQDIDTAMTAAPRSATTPILLFQNTPAPSNK